MVERNKFNRFTRKGIDSCKFCVIMLGILFIYALTDWYDDNYCDDVAIPVRCSK